jgi:transcriptional regulator with XRE-family HTH domain
MPALPCGLFSAAMPTILCGYGNDARMNLVELAMRLKQLRLERGMTLEQVATEAGLTRGWLSKVENFRVTPSLPALSNMASTLGVSLADLFEGLDERPALVIVRKGDGEIVDRDEEDSSYTYEALAHPRPARRMDPFVLTVPPGGSRPMKDHGGEEFMHVLSGRIHLDYDDESHKLASGDSAYFDGTRPHRLRNSGKSPARLLIVYDGVADVQQSGADLD